MGRDATDIPGLRDLARILAAAHGSTQRIFGSPLSLLRPECAGTLGVTMSELWTEQEVSAKYRIPLGTLRYWRHKKTVLPYRKLGSLVRYDPSEVEAAVEGSRVAVDVSPAP